MLNILQQFYIISKSNDYKKKRLTGQEKKENREISSELVANENVIGTLKRFKIASDNYRNRRKRFGLSFNIIVGIHNFELPI
jgi:hypothetical protein